MSGTRVLVIDDDADLRALLSITLRRMAGWVVEAAATGAEGLERARATRPDIVLLDLTLADMEGTAVLEQLKASPATRELMVVVFTAAVQRGGEAELIAKGARAVIAKPIRPPSLLVELQALLSSPRAGP
jgi:CheY-like chemotaxis protein